MKSNESHCECGVVYVDMVLVTVACNFFKKT